MAWPNYGVGQLLWYRGYWGSELTVHLRVATGFKGYDSAAWRVYRGGQLLRYRQYWVSELTIRRHGIVAAGLLMSAMPFFYPLTGCGLRAALCVLKPQMGDTDDTEGKTSNIREFSRR